MCSNNRINTCTVGCRFDEQRNWNETLLWNSKCSIKSWHHHLATMHGSISCVCAEAKPRSNRLHIKNFVFSRYSQTLYRNLPTNQPNINVFVIFLISFHQKWFERENISVGYQCWIVSGIHLVCWCQLHIINIQNSIHSCSFFIHSYIEIHNLAHAIGPM